MTTRTLAALAFAAILGLAALVTQADAYSCTTQCYYGGTTCYTNCY